MREVTDIFALYREAARHLRNTYFSYARTLSWDTVEDAEAVEKVLFQRLVLKRVVEEWQSHKDETDIAHLFRVVPNTTAQVWISTEPSPDGYSWTTSDFMGRLDAEIGFLGYYDHNPTDDFQYIRGVVFASRKRPDCVGHYILIENGNADVFCMQDAQ
jgi:hypothetical protein